MADSPSNIYEKLRKVQLELKVPKGQHNSFGGYNYRNAEDILEAVKPVLDKYGLTLVVTDELIQLPSTSQPQQVELTDSKGHNYTEIIGGDRFYVKAKALLHAGDEHTWTEGFAREEQFKKGMDGSQITGAASSYARKYALNGLFAIDDTKDADSQDNSSTNRKPAIATPKHVNALQAQRLLTKARDVSGLTDRTEIVGWFIDQIGIKPTDVLQADVLDVLEVLEGAV